MAFILTSYDTFDKMEFTVSANDTTGITWFPFTIRYDTISAGEIVGNEPVLNYTAASATYAAYPGESVTWGVSTTNIDTNVIYVTAFNNSEGLCISAFNSTFENASALFYPYRLKQEIISTTDSAVQISAFYSQISSEKYMPLDEGTPIQWNVNSSNENIYVGLSGDEYATQLSVNNEITGYAISATKFALSCVDTSSDINLVINSFVLEDRYINSPLSANFIISVPQTEVTFNPRIRIYTEDIQPTYIILSAIMIDEPVSENIYLNWNILNDSSLINAFTGYNLDSVYTLNSPASGIGYIKLSALDLSKTYQYQLSSYTGEDTGLFRPYNYINEFSLLTVQLIQQPNDNNTYKYDAKVLGVDNATLFNLPANQRIWWECDDIAVSARLKSDDITPYVFKDVNFANVIDNLYIRIIPTIVESTPQKHIATFKIYAIISDGVLIVHEFTIEYSDILSNNAFNPSFRFQYEPIDSTTIYRPITSSAWYSISNTSLILPDSFGYIEYTFSNGVCVIPFDTREENNVSANIFYEFNALTECICSINMSISARTDDMAEYAIRSAPTKSIIFADIPSVSGFVAYPEYYWNGSEWILTDFNSPVSPLSAFGFCHSENYLLSANGTDIAQSMWYIHDINNIDNYTQTLVNGNTAKLEFKPNLDSTYLCISASIFTSFLSPSMPSMYYDTPEGIRFINFASTFDSTSSTNRQHIRIVGPDDIGVSVSVDNIIYTKLPVPNNIDINGSYNTPDAYMPFVINVNAFSFILTSEFWSEQERADLLDNNYTTKNIRINTDYNGESRLGVPLNEVTEILVYPELNGTPQLISAHPIKNDWCFDNIDFSTIGNSKIVAYPINPVIYNSNRYSLTSHDVLFENMVQCFSDLSGVNNVRALTWRDRENVEIKNTCVPYITDYIDEGKYRLRLKTEYNLNSSTYTMENIFPDIITIQNEYISADPSISRIYNNTSLKLPYDLADCFIPPNEWITADNFNASIQKLYDNLTYLGDMSRLYDIPPTEYIGWFGTLYYANSAKRTRWFTSIPHNSFAFDHPEKSINGDFDNIQSIFVKNNIMYISNGTTVSILSSDLWGTLINKREYKTLGDNFSNVRAIELDNDNRIYLLDSFSDNIVYGSRNRILVYSYDNTFDQWILLYEWGGLGGPNAKNKFNNPSDLHIDSNNIIWVADTGNKCVKKYTRTGSWLNTINSEYFTDSEKPISITTDFCNNVFVLTNSKILKFTNDVLVDFYDIEKGAKKIEICQDGGFVYIVYSGKVEKLTVDGKNAGNIAENDFISYTKNYSDVFHDEYRNLYIVNKNHILKYVDVLSIVSLKLDSNIEWPLEKLLVQKDEYVQDWVVNKCYQRLWDNLEIFRRSIIGKFGYQINSNTVTSSVVSSQQPPDDFDFCTYDWLYDKGRLIEQNVVFEYFKSSVRSFLPQEYTEFNYKKADIYIGLNEINAASVYNRCISKLFDCENIILQMIND